jgi:hypothetical protein
MLDYEELLKLLRNTERKKLEEYAESQIEPYNKLIEHSLCKTDHDRKPCHTTDKGEPLCAQTLDALSLLEMAMDNLRGGKYTPATKGLNALPGQKYIMDKSSQEQKKFAFEAVKFAIRNCVKCFPMLCRISIYQQIYSPCYKLYAKKKCIEHNLDLSPDELIEITINKRLLNPSVCFPIPSTETLKAFIYQHIKGSVQDCFKSEKNITENDPSNSGTGATELLIILQDLLEEIDNEIDSIPNQKMRERVQKFFDALKSGKIDLMEDNDEEITKMLGITIRQYRYLRDEYFKPIVESLITLEEFEELCMKLKKIYIEPSNEND